MKIDKKEKAVVVIGSGPGGAQVAYQLTKQGIPVVLLEAGRRIMKEEYVNEEWPAFSQMAWLDKRTMTGNSRIVKDFNGLPTWLVKAVGGPLHTGQVQLRVFLTMSGKLNQRMEA